MTSLQKVIKYAAMAFGFYLVFVIISAIIFAITAIFGISLGIDAYKTSTSHTEVTNALFEETFESVNSLDIKLDISKLNIKKGNQFKVEIYNSSNEISCKTDRNILKIKDNRANFNWFNFSEDVIPEIVIYVPENQKFEKIEIEAGVNETYIESLITDIIDVETGVGKFTIDDIIADVLEIDGGAGETNINNSKVNKLKLDSGVGRFVINSEILDEAKIEAGVGQLIVNLGGNRENYKIKTNTGLGNLLVDGKKVSNDQIIGDGNCFVKVEAGVGEVQVNFIKYD